MDTSRFVAECVCCVCFWFFFWRTTGNNCWYFCLSVASLWRACNEFFIYCLDPFIFFNFYFLLTFRLFISQASHHIIWIFRRRSMPNTVRACYHFINYNCNLSHPYCFIVWLPQCHIKLTWISYYRQCFALNDIFVRNIGPIDDMCICVELKKFKFKKSLTKRIRCLLYSMITIIIIINRQSTHQRVYYYCVRCSFIGCGFYTFYKIKVKSKHLACKSTENLFIGWAIWLLSSSINYLFILFHFFSILIHNKKRITFNFSKH